MDPKDYTPAPRGDFVLAFDLPQLGVRGRLVRLDDVSARALSAHALVEPASRVLGETMVLSTLLGSALKLDGRLSVQTRSDGPLDLVTVDYQGAEDERPIGLRGFARLDQARFKGLNGTAQKFESLAGKGALAITIEPRLGDQTYQGIVELSPKGVAASAETYFAQSEQLPTAVRLAAAPLYESGRQGPHWRAGGMMLQATPEAPRDDDTWERLTIFLASLEDLELVDTSVSAETLLWRLFHEDEVRVHQAEAISFRCDCDKGRITSILRSYGPDEREGLADADGIIRAKCEFCATVHEIAPAELA